jgi:hypothetical protein
VRADPEAGEEEEDQARDQDPAGGALSAFLCMVVSVEEYGPSL